MSDNDDKHKPMTPSFSLSGARNVVLETIKRGEDDDFEGGHRKTIILRVYERLGGHAMARLNMWVGLQYSFALGSG